MIKMSEARPPSRRRQVTDLQVVVTSPTIPKIQKPLGGARGSAFRLHLIYGGMRWTLKFYTPSGLIAKI